MLQPPTTLEPLLEWLTNLRLVQLPQPMPLLPRPPMELRLTPMLLRKSLPVVTLLVA